MSRFSANKPWRHDRMQAGSASAPPTVPHNGFSGTFAASEKHRRLRSARAYDQIFNAGRGKLIGEQTESPVMFAVQPSPTDELPRTSL